MQIILFGLSGSGKNFIGEILQKHFNFYFWDADTALPAPMRECIAEKRPFTQEMRDSFTRIMIANIAELKKTHKKLAIAQALYKEKNRLEIQAAFPAIELLHVTADLENIIARLTYGNNAIDAKYAKMISVNFEKPVLMHHVIDNNSDADAIIMQIRAYLDKRNRDANN
jgi:gluconokinase